MRKIKTYKKNTKYKNTQKNNKIKNQQKNHKTKNSKTNRPNKSDDNTRSELNIFSANADGLRGKTHSLKNEINESNASIFTIQQTKYPKKGKFTMDNFHIFEAIRQNKEQGGTMLGIHKSLEPVLIQEYSESFELIVAEIRVASKEIRIITGYGPQETWTPAERMPFFIALEEEISKANMAGKSVVLEMDANSKLGNNYVKGDPHPMSENGKILAGIIERHALIVANGLEGKSSGLITRKRVTTKDIQESVIDFVIMSRDMLSLIVACDIDSERKHVLTKTTKQNRIESDHNSIVTKFNVEWDIKITEERTEIFNFKDDVGMAKFKEITQNNTILSSIFDSTKDINIQSKKFLKRLNGILHQCFKKIRLTKENKKQNEINSLIKLQKVLKFKTDETSKKELEEVEKTLVEKMSEDLYDIVKNEVKKINSENGGFNSGHLWQLKKKLSGKQTNPPAALIDENGKLATTKTEIEALTLKHYKKVLENRTIKEGLENHQLEREKLCENRIKAAKKNITPDWSIKDATFVIKSLKKKSLEIHMVILMNSFKVEGMI